ncbi:tyrosine-protein phosphatase 99A [Galendromus occidentalis]|uniref:Tyrosine-protein phosphatase 99A n=1 Tax=Galendromus occidentalis TaxID=34638 RepID=A0AAJ7SHD7_9ACAR|nr:tyrosine-protein phosphatase 99A [Galendromus occidentalis]
MRNSQLYISRALTDDSGEYSCGIQGQRKPAGTVKLFVQDVPDPPGTPLVGFFSSRTVDLSWTTSRNTHHSPILHYIIEIRVGEHGEWDSRNRVMTKDNVTRHQLIGLQPFTVYSFRVLAVNTIGASKPSKQSFFMITLREIPEGKPHIVYAQNTSSTSIRIQWTPPPKNTIHGEFEGYRITYKQRERAETDEPREVIIRNSQTTHYTIRNLEVYTQYLVSLQVFNPAGRGPPVVVPVMTDEGIPSAPQNLTADKVTQSSVLLHWAEPAQPNGVIRGYLIHFSQASSRNETQVKKVIGSRPLNEYILSDLKPFSLYHIWVKAYTQRHTGDNSNAVEVKTDVAGPSAPPIFNLTCHNSDSLYIAWGRPSRYYSHVDMYYVHYRSEYAWSFEEIAMDASQDPSQEHHMLIPNLTANTLYEVKVQGATRSVLYHSKLYKGEFSESRRVILSGTGGRCQSWLGGQYPYSGGVGAALIAGIVCLSFALLLALVSFFFWKKHFQAAYYYLDDPVPGDRASSTLVLLSDTFEDGDFKPIDVCQWTKHVADLHADGDIGFSREYDSLQQTFEAELTSDFSQLDENKPKNRYVNIVAYDQTRVTLKPLTEKQKRYPDYINANYIDGYQKPRAYIGTQGPMPSTFDDYWRMVWEQRVHVIVMITNLIERSRRKCDQYWPSEGSCSYGQIQVKFVSEDVMSTYTVRQFIVRHLKQKKVGERTIVQYHYTNWPDHGVPDHPLPVLSFVVRSSAANPPGAGPIIVHCSAGVGRTGTYIVIDAMLRMMRQKKCINVYGFLKHIRRQRNYLVQTEEQYVFIHDALLEAIESGAPTEVPAGQLPRFTQTLAQPSANGGLSLLERQFKLVTVFKAKDFNVVSALKNCNKPKNRSLNLLPIEHFRVHITAKPGQEGSDYINATFVQGFRRLREYVLTQHPLADTIADFWQMVWDHNMKVMVLLCCDQDGKEFPSFFPAQVGASESYEQFTIKRQTNDRIILSHGQDADHTQEIMLLHAPTWLSGCKALFELFTLIKQALAAQGGSESPILVVDRIGGTEGATFCVLSSLYQQINSPLERAADVYLYTKLLHLRRPGVWRSIQDLHSLYQCMYHGVVLHQGAANSALARSVSSQ